MQPSEGYILILKMCNFKIFYNYIIMSSASNDSLIRSFSGYFTFSFFFLYFKELDI